MKKSADSAFVSEKLFIFAPMKANNEDLKFFFKVKEIFEANGFVWHEDVEGGFLWCDRDDRTGLAWMFFLYADAITFILGVNGFQRGAICMDEGAFFHLYQESGGKGSSVLDMTKDDLSTILSHYWDIVRNRINSKKDI